jgi:hypothetical protein
MAPTSSATAPASGWERPESMPRRRTWIALLIGAVVLAAVLTPVVFDVP